MLQNYFKIAFRNLLKHKGYSLINIIGLSVGMAICLLILLYIQHEISFDRFHANGDRIYRVALERKYPGRSTFYAIIPFSFGEAIKNEFPEVENFTRIIPQLGGGTPTIRVGDQVYEEPGILFTDSTFFEIFTFPLVEGDSKTALTKANSVVLTESTAKKYFGEQDAIGKLLQVGDQSWSVTGVCKDVPESSHIQFDILVSNTGTNFAQQPNYVNFSSCSYFLLKPGTNPEAFEAKLPKIVEKYTAGQIERETSISFAEYQKQGNGYRYFVQPMQDIHLHSNLEAELSPNGSIQSVYIFAVIAIFILVLACINFTNLATARSVERAKEVGLRKMFGSERSFLMGQFLTESVFISLISMALTLVLLRFLTPVFNTLSGLELNMQFWLQPLNLLALLGFALLVGLLAGSYPALVLSSFRPIVVLRGKFKTNKEGLGLRNGLVIFQFCISICLIICTMIVYRQMEFLQNKQLGFNKDHLVVLDRAGFLGERTQSFTRALEQIPGVVSAAGTSSVPGEQGFFGISFQPINSKEMMTGRGMVVNDKLVETMQLEIAAGRAFSEEFADSTALLLNEAAAKEFGLTDPIGARLVSNDGFLNGPNGEQTIYTVVGLVKDFHFQSLHQAITPLIFINTERFGANAGNGLMLVRVKPDNFQQTLSQIEQLWKSFLAEQPFGYSFLDENLAALYQAEQRTQRIFGFFSVLAIFIACMGLLGLAAYAISQRTKEIGIRKVLGASVLKVTLMLSKDFLRLVFIAAVVAFPIAWWGMSRWLEDFAYRINIEWWIFAVALLLAVFIALLTISFQAIRAAVANPVKSLRTE
ncbi:MAG: ABC transporter permease [Saprospiraceae bacterium]